MQRNGWHHDLAKPRLLAAFVLVPSLGIVQKYFRTRGGVFHAAVGFLAVLVAHRRSNTLRRSAASVAGGGSDRDESLNLGVTERGACRDSPPPAQSSARPRDLWLASALPAALFGTLRVMGTIPRVKG
jgi:hypothetical protein